MDTLILLKNNYFISRQLYPAKKNVIKDVSIIIKKDELFNFFVLCFTKLLTL